MTAHIQRPRRSILKLESRQSSGTGVRKKVFFDEIRIQEYPIILGDNPAVSCGAPITIDWESSNCSIVDLDFFEFCRTPQRKNRKKLILSVRRRAGFLLASGYSLEDIANATLQAEMTKKMRADSLKSAGWANPWELLSGAVETTGTALKRADVLGVGAVVGAGVQGVNTVVGVGADVTMKTGKMLVGGAMAVTDAGNKLVVRPVGKVVTTTGKVVTTGVTQTGKAIGSGISTTGRAVGSVVNSTGRALSFIVNPLGEESGKRSPKREYSPKRGSEGDTLPDMTSMKVQ